jgi:hypothetical protein
MDDDDKSSLAEFLGGDHAGLKGYLGTAAFNAVGRSYSAKYPSEIQNTKWFSCNLPKFLGQTKPYSQKPELAELASLELALKDAFEAPDVPQMSLDEFAKLAPEDLSACTMVLHPSVRRLRFSTNATSLWAALTCAEQPPRPERLDEPLELIAWRQGPKPRFRMLGCEEAAALDAAAKGISYSELCDLIANLEGCASPPKSAFNYLRGWIEAEVVSELRWTKDNP